MLGLLAIYYIGKSFHDLAGYHDKSRWGFAFAGVGIFYGAQIVFGVIIGLFFVEYLENTILLNVGGVIVGAIAGILFYTYLKNKWENDNLHPPGMQDVLDDII